MSILAIRWTDEESLGYVDIFNVEFFTNKGTTDLQHMVIGPKGGSYRAICKLVVSDLYAELDYQAFSELNNKFSMCLGVLRLNFVNESRSEIKSLDWKGDGDNTFKKAPAEILGTGTSLKNVMQEFNLPSYKIGRQNKQIKWIDVCERPGQGRFRDVLMIAYAGSCCVTGCSVIEVLEAAHIDPFNGESSDHPENGLLLRCDLHALFDQSLMAIDPKTYFVHFAPSTLIWHEYKTINKSQITLPIIGCLSADAIERRWREFCKYRT